MNPSHQHPHAGLTYQLEVTAPDGTVTRHELAPNLVPIEGINHMLNVTLHGVTPVPTWYIGLYEGDYTPTSSITAATLPGLATECTAYDEASRVEFVEAAASGGATSNAANLAEFTMNANKTVMGSFMSSAATKGSVSGVLLSVVRFPSPKVLAAGSILRILAGPAGTSS